MNKEVCAVIMASGHSKRFGSDKLSVLIDGMPMIEHCMRAVSEGGFSKTAVVARSEKILGLAEKYGFIPVKNDDKTDDTAITIRLGINAVSDGTKGAALFVADQPYFKSAKKIKEFFLNDIEKICAVSHNGEKGNPVIFPEKLYPELAGLSPGGRGSDVIKRHKDMLTLCEVDEKELIDIDKADDIIKVL